MVLDRPGGLSSADVNRVQKEMILSNRIPHLLPVFIKEMDGRISLEYNITGKKMLSQMLRYEKLTLTEFYSLLLQAFSLLQDSPKYMLRPEQYILDEEYMFLEGPVHMGTLYLAYVPLQQEERSPEQRLENRIREWITGLMVHITELKGSGVQSLLQYCGREDFHLAGLKQLVIQLMAGEGKNDMQHTGPQPAVSLHPAKTSTGQTPAGSDSAMLAREGLSRKENRESSPYPVEATLKSQADMGIMEAQATASREWPAFAAMNDDSLSDESRGNKRWNQRTDIRDEEPEVFAGEEAEEAEGSTKSTYWLLGGLLGAAAIWRFIYLEHPDGGRMVTSIAATLLLGAVAVLGWKGKFGSLSPRTVSAASDSRSLYGLDTENGFDSDELAFGRESGKRRLRLEADKLTGFLTGRGKKRKKNGNEYMAESWRWSGASEEISSASSAPASISSFSGAAAGRDKAASIVSNPGKLGNTGYSEENASLDGLADLWLMAEDSGTELLQPLSGAENEEGGGQGRPFYPPAYLEITTRENGGAERVELNQLHFMIGRSAEVSQYVSATPGVSRAHVELSRTPDGYVLKDLGSKNGTILQGEPMVSYKEYPVRDGDAFIIAGDRYVFREA